MELAPGTREAARPAEPIRREAASITLPAPAAQAFRNRVDEEGRASAQAQGEAEEGAGAEAGVELVPWDMAARALVFRLRTIGKCTETDLRWLVASQPLVSALPKAHE